jgi:hypothetical protein
VEEQELLASLPFVVFLEPPGLFSVSAFWLPTLAFVLPLRIVFE